MRISKKLVLWCAILVILFVQVPHLAFVFADMSSFPQEWARVLHGTLFAISIDASVLLFAIRGREFYTSVFMGASLVVTIQYYRDYINFAVDPLLAWSTIFISLVGVLVVYFLSREVKAIDKEEQEDKRAKERYGEKAREEALRAEIQSELQQESGITFTDEEREIIKMRKTDATYDEIIEVFRKQGKPIGKDKISKAVKKFKQIYE